MEGVEDGEDVVGREAQGSVGEEGEAPGESESAAQAHYGQGVRGARPFALTRAGEWFVAIRGGAFEEEDPSQHDDKGSEGEGEDYGVVADVHHVMDGRVCDPAPSEHKQ